MPLYVARPHVVAGVTKAALDAQCLADALVAAGNDVEPALAHYDTERRQFGRSLVARAHHLGAYLEAHQTLNEEERRQTHLARDPESFMRDYGAENSNSQQCLGIADHTPRIIVTARPTDWRDPTGRDEADALVDLTSFAEWVAFCYGAPLRYADILDRFLGASRCVWRFSSTSIMPMRERLVSAGSVSGPRCRSLQSHSENRPRSPTSMPSSRTGSGRASHAHFLSSSEFAHHRADWQSRLPH